jgi:hypothetical protein
MRITITALLTAACLYMPGLAIAANASLDVSENTLNRIIDKMGDQSDSGIGYLFTAMVLDPVFTVCEHIGYIDCPRLDRVDLGFDMGRIPLAACHGYGGGTTVVPTGESVAWQWWVSNVSIELTDGHMRLTATVTTNVDSNWQETTNTVNVRPRFEPYTNNLVLMPEEFKVTLVVEGTDAFLRVDPVDVAKMYTLSVPVHPQKMDVVLPGGSTRNITGKVEALEQFTVVPDNLKVTFDVKFTTD